VSRASGKCRGSESVTRGVRIVVAPQYLPEQSEPGQNRYVFGYRIRVVNEGESAVQLMLRHWEIVDGDGERNVVNGEGVVGQKPTIAPGQTFEYASYCPLATTWGTMEGKYTLRLPDGEQFEAGIARFFLVADATEETESRKPAVTG